MRALNRKLWRDLWKMKGQAFAIVLVIVSGVADLRHVKEHHELPETDAEEVLSRL